MGRSRRTAGALVLAGALALAGCGSEGSDGDAAPTTDAPTTDAAPTTDEVTTSTTEAPAETTTTADDEATTTTAIEEGEEGVDTETSVLDTLPDGEHYGYIAGLEEGTVEGQAVQVIIWDEVELLTGDAADAAAAEDGAESPVPNDYYIDDGDQTVRRLAVVPDASVSTLADGGSELVPSSVDEVWQQDHLFKILVGNVRDITTISSIEAVYLP